MAAYQLGPNLAASTCCVRPARQRAHPYGDGRCWRRDEAPRAEQWCRESAPAAAVPEAWLPPGGASSRRSASTPMIQETLANGWQATTDTVISSGSMSQPSDSSGSR